MQKLQPLKESPHIVWALPGCLICTYKPMSQSQSSCDICSVLPYQPGSHVEILSSLSQKGPPPGTVDWYHHWLAAPEDTSVLARGDALQCSLGCPCCSGLRKKHRHWYFPPFYDSGSLEPLRKEGGIVAFTWKPSGKQQFQLLLTEAQKQSFELGWHLFTSFFFLFGLISLLSQRHLPILTHSSSLKKVKSYISPKTLAGSSQSIYSIRHTP